MKGKGQMQRTEIHFPWAQASYDIIVNPQMGLSLSLSLLVFLFFPMLLFPLPPFPFALLFPSLRPQIPEELTERIKAMRAFGGSKASWLQGQQLCAGELWLRGRWCRARGSWERWLRGGRVQEQWHHRQMQREAGQSKKIPLPTNPTQHALNSGIVPAILSYPR